MATDQPWYTLINTVDESELPTEQDLRKAIESGNLAQRTMAMKQLIIGMLKGDKYPNLVMFVIRFILPLKDHLIKKLLLLYFEIVPKTSPDGKLLPHMILVCDAYRKDLQSPNEYVRGSTLRFLCKLKEAELLEPLMPAVRICLEHRHSYVRRNAVLCIYTIYKSFPFLIPDAPDLVYTFLQTEQDLSCRRNAFMMLIYADQDKALDYLSSVVDEVQSFGDILQLVIVELVHKVCLHNPSERAKFIRCVYTLINSQSAAVRYEAAGTLLALSAAPTAISAAAETYIDLVVNESDNNIRLVVLQRIAQMTANPVQERVVRDSVMDLMRGLNTPSLEARKTILEICMKLIVSRNVAEVVQVLKKELVRTQEETEASDEYRQLLVKALHTCAVKFPQVADTIVPVLMEFVGDTNAASAGDVIGSVREALEFFPELRPNIVERLLETFSHIKSAEVCRTALWLLGEYCENVAQIDTALELLLASIGPLPIVSSELDAVGESDEGNEKAIGEAKPMNVTVDGIYASQSALTSSKHGKGESGDTGASLRSLLLEGDFFLGAVLASSLAKLVLRRSKLTNMDAASCKATGLAMLVQTSLLHLGQSGLSSSPIDSDSYRRIICCLRATAEPRDITTEILLADCRKSLSDLLKKTSTERLGTETQQKKEVVVQVDDMIGFRQLGEDDTTQAEDLEKSLSLATGGETKARDALTSSLSKIHQLTGLSDPVYAEASVTVQQYDIIMDVLVVNQTEDTLQNLSLELSTLGDLKLAERPAIFSLGPRDFLTITANVKVSSTETGIIFGNIVYDISGTTEHCVVVLSDVHVDVMDYINPAMCTDAEFRSMWTEFEWENKVVVNTNITSLEAYTQHIIKNTNMQRLAYNTGSANADDCRFYAANLYARSVFGEDALANLCIELDDNNHIAGHVRIRAKSQGIALSLGDKITMIQKSID